ncbi:MAG: SHOCT domain-containing protein [Caldimonas sp.]
MRNLSPHGEQTLLDVALRHGFSVDAVRSLFDSLIDGHGAMAQFSHPEFSGSGQWMRGGMVMVSDMFNTSLKGRVDALCRELAGLLADEADGAHEASTSAHAHAHTHSPSMSQSQSQSQHPDDGPGWHEHDGGRASITDDLVAPDDSWKSGRTASLFADAGAARPAGWWPGDLGRPASTGAQDGARYAVFPETHRLAIETAGRVTVYDSLDHRIGGVSQQQSGHATMTFTSQHGTVELDRLPVVSHDDAPATRQVGTSRPGNGSHEADAARRPAPAGDLASARSEPREADAARSANNGPARKAGPESSARDPAEPSHPSPSGDDPISTIERLAALRDKGVLTADEFEQKKKELLGRL